MNEEKKIQELQTQIDSLKSELKASLRREELLRNPTAGSSKIKQFIKGTALYKVAKNPSSKIGKIVRFPRSVFRIVSHPGVIREILSKNSPESMSDAKEIIKNVKDEIFYPIGFFFDKNSEAKINLITDDKNEDIIKEAAEYAIRTTKPLRIITNNPEITPITVSKILKEDLKKIKIEFYNPKSQNDKNGAIYKLVINENDIFITKAWKKK